ncbi:hypothetical protein K6V78_07830 [Streptococcus gallolyticus]|nr:hypothetical protein [Streptococcus gallolyticus]MBY5041220.1 hypothetical protein [Streptococcus gallolyticus]
MKPKQMHYLAAFLFFLATMLMFFAKSKPMCFSMLTLSFVNLTLALQKS